MNFFISISGPTDGMKRIGQNVGSVHKPHMQASGHYVYCDQDTSSPSIESHPAAAAHAPLVSPWRTGAVPGCAPSGSAARLQRAS